jgi:hypothetical protein
MVEQTRPLAHFESDLARFSRGGKGEVSRERPIRWYSRMDICIVALAVPLSYFDRRADVCEE